MPDGKYIVTEEDLTAQDITDIVLGNTGEVAARLKISEAKLTHLAFSGTTAEEIEAALKDHELLARLRLYLMLGNALDSIQEVFGNSGLNKDEAPMANVKLRAARLVFDRTDFLAKKKVGAVQDGRGQRDNVKALRSLVPALDELITDETTEDDAHHILDAYMQSVKAVLTNVDDARNKTVEVATEDASVARDTGS